jgi:glyoxylase-like metal-dependent hydrolase (beta-lactamase superfamily II)
MKFGSFEIIPFVERHFRLDGGTMFGVVPKKIWSRHMSVDDDNLIPMETNLFVLKAGGRNILLDTGFGDAISDREKKIYAVDSKTNIESGLKEIGLTADDIDMVFLSHLHTDHAGGAVKMDGDKYVPRFDNATYIVQKAEWEDAMHPDERTAAVYIPERLACLEQSGQLQLVDGEQVILDGVKVVKTGGHTPGHQAIEATSDGTTVVYYADIIPSSLHVKIPYVAAVDLDPSGTMDLKRKLVERLLHDDMAIVFDHDTEIKIGRLVSDDKGVKVEKIE